MLELRPSCECCDSALPPESTEARICSFENGSGSRAAHIAWAPSPAGSDEPVH